LSRQWRSKSQRSLMTRPIYEREFPSLGEQMANDGLTLVVGGGGNGYTWFIADYEVPVKSVREVWGLTAHQMRRFVAWAIENDCEVMTWES